MTEAFVVSREQESLGASNHHLYAFLSSKIDRKRRIVDIERAPFPYASSWWLEEISLNLDDNSRITLVFKNLIRETHGSGAGRIKPAFVTDPSREPWVYRELLPKATSGPPKLWAAVTDFAARRHWLFLERVDGVPLSEIGELDAWCSAARWLGDFHTTAPVSHAARGQLLRHDQAYHRRWLTRALSTGQERARLRALAPAHERAIEEALGTGQSLIHGEFYPSNVLVHRSGATCTVHPVDWEMAALGPPLLDLAALISGRWATDDRIAMMHAYLEGARAAGARQSTLAELMRGVAACRLLLAVQWLGWAAGWTAPADHRNDWLEEAERCAEELRG